jgi:hypothetical protein
MLARGGWDPAKHPRSGAPPNPGWFAPTGGPSVGGPTELAQGYEEERASEEILDPLAALRQAQWDAAIATLREIDPSNPNLTYVANPGSAPSQRALDRLNAVVEAATIKRVTDKVMPGGVPIGKPGHGLEVQVLPGGVTDAQELFDYVRVGGSVWRSEPNRTVVRLPGNAGYTTYRPNSKSSGPAIDINVTGVTFDKIHFQRGD